MSAYDPQTSFTGNETYQAMNPILSKVGDFTPFYIVIAICSGIFSLLILLNIVCCCSRYTDYWLDRHSGNRWIVSIWSVSPEKQPPVDFTELESQQQVQCSQSETTENQEGQKHSEHSTSMSRQSLTASQEYLDLHTIESDI